MNADSGRVIAVLGPTNTGKTHYAVERMLGHASGMIGFPLRLLAREIYDKVSAIAGANRVALVTGEEKIVPPRPAYWICTVESMPLGESVEFLAVDEIQLAADAQRGHIFTDRLLHARGREETVMMGAQTMEPVIRRLLPDVQILPRTRFSQLRFVEPRKLHRLPRRSAIIGFSAETVYSLAELVRRQRGGAAVVMGALSPRTRNAQVALYQEGEVDYLVATDAIGMGLNMDIDHVAFAETAKFDGRTTRRLEAAEVAQIAGRAGRYMNDGTFSTLVGSETGELDPAVVARVEEHAFRPVSRLLWRNARLDFRTPGRLVAALEAESGRQDLVRMREALDLASLKALSQDGEIAALARTPAAVRQLWEICQIPDFRRSSENAHLGLLRRLYLALMSPAGVVPSDWLAREISRLDNPQGDIDTLSSRIASIRTWTYIANRQGWLRDSAHWADLARAVEDKLSDALHDRLRQRFVDRRTSVLMRQLQQQGDLSVSVNDNDEIRVEDHPIGRLEGFTFRADPSATGQDYKALEAAADKALKAELARRAKLFVNAGHKNLELDFGQGLHRPRLLWQGAPLAFVEKGGSAYEPRVRLVAESRLAGAQAESVRAACQSWLDARLRDKLGHLLWLKDELDGAVAPKEGHAPLEGLARGVAFQLLERFGVIPRKQVARELRQLDQPARKSLRRFRVRIGATSLYMPPVLKPHAVELRLMLWALDSGSEGLPAPPPPGLVWIATDPDAPREFYELAGFRLIGNHEAVRLDMLERLADVVRPLGQRGESFTVTPEIMGLAGCSGESFARTMRALGYSHEKRLVSVAERNAREGPGGAEAAAETAQAASPAGDTEKETGASAAATPSAAAESGIDADAQTAAEDPSGTEMVEEYVFRWAPKTARPPAARQPAGDKPARGRKSGKTDARGDRARRSASAAAGKQSAPRRHGGQPVETAQEDSPFAQLKGLKEALEKRQ